jgi:transcriptional regulator with XRE-family HTH domain
VSINDLLHAFKEAENTADYQLESVVIDLTEQICEIMEAKGISRADLARKLDKSRAWVTKVLRGDQNLTLKTVVDVFWELGYRIEFESHPKMPSWSEWGEYESYSSRDVVSINVYSEPLDSFEAEYEDQPLEEPMEQENVVAA